MLTVAELVSSFKGSISMPPAPWSSDELKSFQQFPAVTRVHRWKTTGHQLQFASSELPVGLVWQSACPPDADQCIGCWTGMDKQMIKMKTGHSIDAV